MLSSISNQHDIQRVCLLFQSLKKRGYGSLQPAGVKKEEFWYKSAENWSYGDFLCNGVKH